MRNEPSGAVATSADEPRAAVWSVLVVDDEKDIHDITHLALKRRTWRKKPFELTSCFSAREPRQILATSSRSFHVALVDVVMESPTAGLDLCQYIRAECPTSVRIILRTGLSPVSLPKSRLSTTSTSITT
jgi:DNA-binding NtrC family response regulator